MTLTDILKRSEKLVADNSPAILTAMGVAGTITAMYLTGKASFKAGHILSEESPHLDIKEKTALVWKEYIPAVGTGAVAVVCIVGSNRISNRRAAALAAAYTVSERAWAEYKDKVVERIGAQKEQKVRDEVAQDQVDRNPVSSKEVIVVGNGDVLCYDSITGRYFQSNVEAIRKAVNDINRTVLHNMYASLYEFYDLIGLPPTDYSQEVGWNSDTELSVDFSTVLADDGRPCVSLNYNTYPIRDYYRVH